MAEDGAAVVAALAALGDAEHRLAAQAHAAAERAEVEPGDDQIFGKGACLQIETTGLLEASKIRTQSATATIFTTYETPTFTVSPGPLSAFLNMSQAPHSRFSPRGPTCRYEEPSVVRLGPCHTRA